MMGTNQGTPNKPARPPAHAASPWQAGYVPPPGGQGGQPVQRRPGPAGQGSRPGSPLRWLLVIAAIAAVALGAVWGVNSLRASQVQKSLEPYAAVYPPNMFINDIPLEGLTPQQAYDKLDAAMQERIGSWNLAVTYQGHTFITLDYGLLGSSIPTDQLYNLLNEAWLLTRQGTVFEQRAALDALLREPHKAYTTTGELQSDKLRQMFSQIASYMNTPPQDAMLLEFRPDDKDPFVIQSERHGLRLDTEAAVTDVMAMAGSGQSGSYELKPELLPPKVTRAEIEQTVALRTSITTAIASSSPDNRNHNIRLSFSKFNGKVLKPGQTFSFNDVVGPRTLAAGFAEALEYAYGELEIGVGGGVCQASTTLYQAAMTAGLDLVKRYPHSGPVDYAKLGQDATVFLSRDRNLDLKFKNTTAGNIYITAHVQTARNSSKRLVAVINMYGLSLGDNISYRLRSDVVQTLPPPDTKKYEVDKTGLIVTYSDEEKLKSRAVEGQVIETYLEKYQGGVLVEQPKLLTSDTFPAKPAVYWRGANKRN